MQITLRAARVNKKWTTEKAASEIQKELDSFGVKTRRVTRDVIYDWERGRTVPNVMHVKAIERAYGVSYNDLIFCNQNTVKQ
jgi:transcriptional regulator with XRE-family HTH domain